MALMIQALGGVGKAVIGAGGHVLKTGARIFGSDAVEAIGTTVGKLKGGIDNLVQTAVKQDEVYKAAQQKARGIKEAATETSDAAKQAVSKKANIVYSRDGDKYYRQVEGGKRVEIDSKTYGQANSTRIAIDKKNTPSHTGYTNSNYSSTFTIEEEIASEMAESKTGFWSGLGEMASDHPYIAASIAGGTGLAAGGLIFGGDDD